MISTVPARTMLLFGTVFGFVVSAVGFTSYEELHRMLTFVDLRMLLSFATGVLIAGVGFHLMRKQRPLPARPLHRGSIPGGVLFGVGWAVAGTCPGVAFAQLGQGRVWAVVTIAGIFAGTALYNVLHARYLRFDRGTCG